MTKTRFIGASLLALFVSVGGAAAADLPRAPAYIPPPAPAPIGYNWTGAYAGLSGGWGWGSWGGDDPDGGFFGGFLGYNWQWDPNWVFGVEGDLHWADINSNLVSTDWVGSARGRLGYAWDRFLLYGTAGVSFSQVDVGFTSSNRAGWVVGAGVDVAFTNTVFGRLEYDYTDFGKTGGHTFGANTLKLGVGFRF